MLMLLYNSGTLGLPLGMPGCGPIIGGDIPGGEAPAAPNESYMPGNCGEPGWPGAGIGGGN